MGWRQGQGGFQPELPVTQDEGKDIGADPRRHLVVSPFPLYTVIHPLKKTRRSDPRIGIPFTVEPGDGHYGTTRC
jgi:hypothetical protein